LNFFFSGLRISSLVVIFFTELSSFSTLDSSDSPTFDSGFHSLSSISESEDISITSLAIMYGASSSELCAVIWNLLSMEGSTRKLPGT